MESESTKKIMLTIQECADYSGMSPGAIRRCASEGKLRHVKVGVKVLINKSVFDEFIMGTAEPSQSNNVISYGTIRKQEAV